MLFDGVFGTGTSIRYTAQFDGYKEDIILADYNGTNEFVFNVKTNGLSLVKRNDGNIILIDPNTSVMVASLGSLMIYDSSVDGNGMDKYSKASLYNHYYIVSELTANNEYLVTVHVDEDYLKAEDTVYPVYVDPTLTVWYTTISGNPNSGNYQNGSNYIQTTYIQNNVQTNYGSTVMKVGGGIEDSPASRSLINFEWLSYSNPSKNPLIGKNITSAYLYVRDLFPAISEMIVGLYGVNYTWNVNTVTGTAWNYYSSKQYGTGKRLAWHRGVEAIGDMRGDSVGHWYYFDIAEYVKNVLNNGYAFGFMLKATDATNEAKAVHTLAGSGYLGNTSLRPALVVTYNGMCVPQNASEIKLYEEEKACEEVSVAKGTNVYYKFNATANITYYFESVGQWSANTGVRIYNAAGQVFATSDWVPSLEFKSASNCVFYIQIVSENASTTSGSFLISRDYTGQSGNFATGKMIAFFDNGFRDRYGSTQAAKNVIKGYFDHVKTYMKKYLNIEMTYDSDFANLYSFQTNSGNNTFYAFYQDSFALRNSYENEYIYVFTGSSLTASDAQSAALISHNPAAMDCAYSEHKLIMITRQERLDYIKYSAWHETLHTFGAHDHRCYSNINTDTCENLYCYYHTLVNNEEDTDGVNEFGYSYSTYKFYDINYINDICIMFSPILQGCKENICGICIRDIFKYIGIA